MRVKSDCRQFHASECEKNIVRKVGRKERQPKEFNINIVHAQTHGVDPAVLPSRTRLLPSRGSLSSSEKTRPPLPATVSLRSSYHLHRPSPPPLLTGSDRHRHHRAIAIAAKTNKTSGKNGSRMQREKKRFCERRRNGMKNARDSESSFRWSY